MMMAHDRARDLSSCVAALLALCLGERQAGATEWVTFEHQRTGFLLAYPADNFALRPGGLDADGLVLISRDGKAQIAVAAFPNEEGLSLESYRNILLEENYADADIDYQPKRSTWFVLSGTRGQMHFYERVTFTCEGRLINSWALYYPVAARPIYDPIVENIAKRYRPGRGASGDCETAPAP